jgi:hypothetical protein
MENLGNIINNSVQKFILAKKNILDNNIGYVLLAVMIIMIVLIIILSGTSLGFCNVMDLGRICEIKSVYRTSFLTFTILGLIFWIVYYINIRKQTYLIDTYSPKGFFPPEAERSLNLLSEKSKILLIFANLFTLPIYVLCFLILFNVIRFLFKITGLPFLK